MGCFSLFLFLVFSRQIFPDPVEVVTGPAGTLACVPQGKERLPSIVVEPTDISEVESGELRWPPEQEDSEDEDLFLEQCIPPANIADWGDEDDDESIIIPSQPSTSLLGVFDSFRSVKLILKQFYKYSLF